MRIRAGAPSFAPVGKIQSTALRTRQSAGENPAGGASLEGEATRRGVRLETGTIVRSGSGSFSAPSAILESEPAEVPEPFRKRIGRRKPTGVQALRSPPLARSSKAERSPDKRGTTERYRPGQPVSEG